MLRGPLCYILLDLVPKHSMESRVIKVIGIIINRNVRGNLDSGWKLINYVNILGGMEDKKGKKCSAGKKEQVVDEDIRMEIVALSRKLDYLSA